MPFVRANGLSFHVQEMGAGPPVVLVHGLFLGNLSAWFFVVAPALARSHRVLCYDGRGHGLSDRVPSGYDLATLTSDFTALTERFGEPLDIVGHSYGSLIGLRFALDHPERVRRMVLVETPLPPHQVEETRDLVGGDPAELSWVLEPERLRRSVLAHKDADALLTVLPEHARRALLGGPRGMRNLARKLRFLVEESTIIEDVRREPDIADEELARIDRPVLCIYGRTSACRPVGDRLVRVLPDARLLELDAGHYLMNQKPRELTAAIEQFLGEGLRG